jgi:hypothetical protein
MAQQEYYTILTSAGLAYEANRKAAGLPIKLEQMSVGDGNGAVYNPDATQTALRREVWRGPINALLQDATNPSYLVGELSLPDDVGGWYVREVGFWTDTGILYAIGKYPESYKPQLASGAGKEFYIRAIFETSNAASVTLVVDDTVVKATRAFVIDYVAAELAKRDSKNSVRVATTGAIVLSGAQSIDGVAVVAGDRVLVKNQATGSQNGIYVAANGAWSRAADADAILEVTPGLFVHVEQGTAGADSVWQLTTDAPITLGTTPLVFEMIAGRTGVTVGTYTKVTVDELGRVIAGASPTTLAGLGIDNAYTKAEVDAQLTGAAPKGYLSGFTMSVNAAAPTTTIDVQPGTARGQGNPVTLGGAMSCVLQAAGDWSAGSGGNKLDTGARAANSWYHLFAMRRLSDGQADQLFSLSLQAAVVPAGYELVRRIGSIRTDGSGNILAFINRGRHFSWHTPPLDVSITSAVVNGVYTISVPPGAPVMARLGIFTSGGDSYSSYMSPDAAQITPGFTTYLGGNVMSTGVAGDYGASESQVMTNEAAAVRFSTGALAPYAFRVVTYGWIEL